jgi:hypothetical protein
VSESYNNKNTFISSLYDRNLEALGYEVVAVTEKGDITSEYEEGNTSGNGEQE